MVLDFAEDIKLLRSHVSRVSLESVLNGSCDATFLQALDELVRKARSKKTAHLGYLLPSLIAARLPVKNDAWVRIRDYCKRRLNDDFLAPTQLFEAIVCIFQPIEVGAWIEQGIVSNLEPRFEFDNDGLLVGPIKQIRFEKEGILTNHHWILYDRDIPGGAKSGAFLDDLLETVSNLSVHLNHFGLAINSDAVLDISHYFPSFTRAYIRGPRGLSEAILQDASFPQDPSGTVTEHRRVGDDPLYALFPLDRTEFMWSSRDGIKSIQIEELVTPDSLRMSPDRGIVTRYVHAQWSPLDRAFIHFDGAVKVYTHDAYQKRLQTDLKKFPGKASSYKKLFRIDSPLGLDIWCRLTAKFFEENELVLEYLGGPRKDEEMA